MTRAQKTDNMELHLKKFEDTKMRQEEEAKWAQQEQEELDNKIKVSEITCRVIFERQILTDFNEMLALWRSGFEKVLKIGRRTWW